MPQLCISALSSLPDIVEGDDLAGCIVQAVEREGLDLHSQDILVIAQKIVSKAEGARLLLSDIEPSPRARQLAEELGKDPNVVEVVLRQSSDIVRCRPGVLIVEDIRGFVLANAGVDASNVDATGEAILTLPENPDRSAQTIQMGIADALGVHVGVVINDSWGRPFRNGTVGFAIGVAGIPAIVDADGAPDMFGRPLRATHIAVADEIAAAGSLLMGGGAERRPVSVVRGLNIVATDRTSSVSDLLRDKSVDLFR